jgi:hypothetical protein
MTIEIEVRLLRGGARSAIARRARPPRYKHQFAKGEALRQRGR